MKPTKEELQKRVDVAYLTCKRLPEKTGIEAIDKIVSECRMKLEFLKHSDENGILFRDLYGEPDAD